MRCWSASVRSSRWTPRSAPRDPARMIAAAVTLGVGLVTRNVLAAILSGMTALYLGLYFIA